jgi:hypothetical protein
MIKLLHLTRLTVLIGPAYNISAQTVYNTPILCCNAIVSFLSVGVIKIYMYI